MRKGLKKISAVIISISMVLSSLTIMPVKFQNYVYADTITTESDVTSVEYDFAYSTPGYADGTIYIHAKEDGVYKVFWGDKEGNKLSRDGHEYTYLARVVVKDGEGSYNIISDYTAIPDGAEKLLVYKKDNLQYTYDLPADKVFHASESSYTFGAAADPHFGRYSSVYNDDAVPAMDMALDFFADANIEFVGLAGDLTTAGEQTSLDKYNAALAKHPEMTVLSCLGNHDGRTTLSTSSTSTLDTSIIRWYNTISSGYYTVDEQGIVNNNLAQYSIAANDALSNPIRTQYRPSAGEDGVDTYVPGMDFVTEAGDNVFIFFNEVAKTGETYDTDKLVTTGQMDWLEQQFETYKDKNVFMFFHSYLAVNPSNGDAVDYNNCVGDLKNAGGYSYDLDFKDVVTTTSGLNMQALFNKYSNVTMFSGHSHWLYSMQELNPDLNIGRLLNGEGATLVHLSSITEPRYIAENDTSRTGLNGYASEGTVVTVYDDCIMYYSADFYNGQYEAYATYIVPTGDNSQYQPVKNSSYKESATAITGDNYLDAEDMTTLQLLKSDFNLTLGAAYQYSSKGSENTDGALTDGKSTGSYFNSKENKNTEQHVIITLDEQQQVSNLKNFMIYFVNALTDSASYNIQLSQDGETYETVGTYTDMTYKTTTLDVDTSNVSFDTFKYIKLNLTGGTKTYGYQIREFAAIGYERNQNPNTAGSASSLIEGTIDETDLLDTDYNLIYCADYTQSTVGSENKEGALTDGKLSGFANTERNSSAKEQTFIIDLGKSKIQNVSNIAYFLLYSQNADTNVTEFDVEISLDGETYQPIGAYSNVDIDTTHFDPDTGNVTLEKFRYVKLHLTSGKTGYGYQIKEFAVIGTNPIIYPEIEDQASLVSNLEKNLALNKNVYVSSTYAGEGGDPTVLTDGKTNKHWSSDWDSTRKSDYIIVDLGAEYKASDIESVLINFKSSNTFCENFTIEFSDTYNQENPEEGFYQVEKTKVASWEALQKISDSNGYVVTKVTEQTEDNIRYVKINMNGHKSWGFQVLEVAVIKSDKAAEQETTTQPETPVDYKKDISKCVISVAELGYIYSGSEIRATFVVLDGSQQLEEGKDYRIQYSNNINVGTAKITVYGIGDYEGVLTGTFTIVKSTEQDTTKINDGTTTQNPTTKANTKVAKTKIKKAQNVKGRKIKLSWKKIKGVTGYKIRYATNSKFKKAKTITIKKNKVSYTLKKLKRKNYYIQVRAYKVVNKKTYLGKWSKKKKVVVKK